MWEVVPLREYELVMVLRPDVPEEDVPATIERVQQFVTGRGGTVLNTDTWGRRKLAYPIKKYFEGNYIVTQLRLEPRDARDLETNLRLNDHVIRHLLVRTDED